MTDTPAQPEAKPAVGAGTFTSGDQPGRIVEAAKASPAREKEARIGALRAAQCGPGFMTMSDYQRLRATHDAWIRARDTDDPRTSLYAALHHKASREVFGRLEAERLQQERDA